MSNIDLKALDKKLTQVCLLTAELKDLRQSLMLKEGIINDMVQDIIINDLKYPKDSNFSLVEIMMKIRELSAQSGLIIA